MYILIHTSCPAAGKRNMYVILSTQQKKCILTRPHIDTKKCILTRPHIDTKKCILTRPHIDTKKFILTRLHIDATYMRAKANMCV